MLALERLPPSRLSSEKRLSCSDGRWNALRTPAAAAVLPPGECTGCVGPTSAEDVICARREHPTRS